MRHRLPATEHLITLVTIARVGSFTKAAQELDVTQSALSRHIMTLQRQLGIKLFERVGRHARLTPAGAELCARAQPILDELARTTEALTAASGAVGGRVRLGASESVAVNSLPAILRSYLQHHGRVQVRLTCRTSEQLPELVREGSIDVAVCPLDSPPKPEEGLAALRLWEEEIVLVLPISHPGRSRSLASYLNEDFIMVLRGTETRRTIERALAEQGHQLRVVLEHESTEVIKAMVMAGLGLSLLPEPNVRREARRGELAVLPLSDLRVTRTIYAIHDARRQLWPAEQALLEALQRYRR
ncbi:MAG: LysR family transcriptional regulator [Planctomycetes bacterium]|nr:LysR family transcriptional regulator [Planctomycetota bacterium]